jgi:hypothetical protein
VQKYQSFTQGEKIELFFSCGQGRQQIKENDSFENMVSLKWVGSQTSHVY